MEDGNKSGGAPVNSSEPNKSVSSGKSNKNLSLIIIGVILVLVIAGGAYAYHASKHKTTTSTVASGAPTGKTFKPITSGPKIVKTPVTTTTSCGADPSCFNTSFKDCTPATLTSSISNIAVKYQILGPQGGGCSMSFVYTKASQATWLNQPMTCNFDNKQSLQASVTAAFTDLSKGNNTYSCVGPFVAVLQHP